MCTACPCCLLFKPFLLRKTRVSAGVVCLFVSLFLCFCVFLLKHKTPSRPHLFDTPSLERDSESKKVVGVVPERCRVDRLSAGRGAQGGRGLRLPAGLSAVPLTGRRLVDRMRMRMQREGPKGKWFEKNVLQEKVWFGISSLLSRTFCELFFADCLGLACYPWCPTTDWIEESNEGSPYVQQAVYHGYVNLEWPEASWKPSAFLEEAEAVDGKSAT